MWVDSNNQRDPDELEAQHRLRVWVRDHAQKTNCKQEGSIESECTKTGLDWGFKTEMNKQLQNSRELNTGTQDLDQKQINTIM